MCKSVFVCGVAIWLTTASGAARTGNADTLKGDIEAHLKQLGILHWDGADTFTVHEDGDEAIAVIENGHFSVRKDKGEPKPP